MATFPTYAININQGATWVKLFTYLDSDGETPINLTGFTARMQLRQSYTSETPVINLTTENGGIVITPLTGEIEVTMTATQTAGIPAREYFYDLEIESSGGIVYRVIEGRATVRPEVTRNQGVV